MGYGLKGKGYRQVRKAHLDNDLSHSLIYNTVYCNNRELVNDSGWNPNGNISHIRFNNEYSSGNLTCNNGTDKFSVNNPCL